MNSPLAAGLDACVDAGCVRLQQIGEDESLQPFRPGGWTRKEVLGHLIDSAANNHVRFVSGSLAAEFRGPTYDADGWVDRHAYNSLPWTQLVDFWSTHNRLLVRVLTNVPASALGTLCYLGTNSPVTLGFVIEDYILHMQHHLDQIYGDVPVTQYPSAASAGT